MIVSIHFTRGSHRFEIVRSDGEPVWIGYLDGERRATAAEPHLVARALLQMPVQRTVPYREALTPTS
jgi:hypothetical protein